MFSYSYVSRYFDDIIVVFVLSDQLYIHTEHNMGKGIVRCKYKVKNVDIWFRFKALMKVYKH